MLKIEKIKNTIIQGDCLKVMRDFPDKSIDMVLTDPPYGVNLEYDIYKDTEENWYDLMKKVMPEFLRIGKMIILPSCQIKRLKWIYDNFPPDWLICWYKGSVGCAGFLGFNDWEPHLVYGKNNTNMHDYFKATPESHKNGHPCPKPLEWAMWLISRATKENDLILDPFIGSGTTAVACKRLKRNYIGIELSKEYCEIARQRIRGQAEPLF